MASRAERGQAKSFSTRRPGSFGKGEGGVTARLRELPADHLLTMQATAEWLRVSRWSVYTLIHANQLRTIKIGRRRLVSREALNECVKQLAKGAA